MGNILLLYDTSEKDLARDLKDLLIEFDLNMEMIPLSPDFGKTLQAKEEHYFDVVNGAIFLITPGSERNGRLFPSPSVADEMGQAKQKFKNIPEKVIYLVDTDCNLQAIDQKAYIPFSRENARSMLEAITLLVKNLKAAGLVSKKRIEHRETPGINIDEYSKSIDASLKAICFDLSGQPNGFIGFNEFENLLKTKYQKSNRDINFIKRDIQTRGLVAYLQPRLPNFYGGWQLSNIGFELVRYEIEKAKKDESNSLASLAKLLSGRTGLLGQSSLLGAINRKP